MSLDAPVMTLLDRPVWASLSTQHLALSVGGPLARRYASGVNLFASARDDSSAALAALADLVHPGERIFILQVPEILVPAGLVSVKSARGVQMIATRSLRGACAEDDLVELTAADAPEMLALAKLTEPGPFLARTHTMGAFRGIRVGGRLAAMAGERFRFPGHTEVSGVCTHPDFRGRGFARRLSAAVAARIESRGEQPFLHSWKGNQPAIALYQSLGFEIRAEVDVQVLERTSSPAQRES
ncbi:MAG TPA: GNAT family N-acetyltransferase [Steroidobacteraceae bacterium]|nr:GNAT family N-acetyltransferase [Steroidobacteraceae bacterium]